MLKHNVRFWLLRTIAIALASAASGIAVPKPGVAQNVIIPDATLGSEASQVIPVPLLPTIDLIQGGAIRGQNLFHSFEQFSIGEVSGAYFITPSADIANIFTRITGGGPSQILGILGARQADFSPSSANLFLINPNGILFGANSLLDVGGSFVATTADTVDFGGLGIFSSLNPSEPLTLLTINPSALLFTQPPTQGIANRSTALTGFLTPSGELVSGLRVPNGQGILFVGGGIDIEGGRLNALGGRIELGGLAEPGRVELATIDGSYRLSFPENALLADLSLSGDARVSVRGIGGGDIIANFNLITALEGGRLVAGTEGTQNGGNILINAQNLQATGIGIFSGLSSGIYNQATPSATGSAGDIFLETDTFILQDQGGINSRTFGQGNGGNIYINSELISLDNGSFITLENLGSGEAGNLNITALDLLSLSNASQVLTNTIGDGDAGNITIWSSNEIILSGGSSIRSETSGSGNGGIVDVYATSRISFDGTDILGNRSGIITSVNPSLDNQAGRIAGDIIVRTTPTGTLLLSNGAGFFSNVEAGAIGQGGNIDIQAGWISLSNSQIQSILRGSSIDLPGAQGATGRIVIRADRDFLATDQDTGFPSGLFSTTDIGTIGASNDIYLEAASVTLSNGGRLSTETGGLGNSGNITVIANDAILIDNDLPNSVFSSGVFSQVNPGAVGNGGTILIDAQSLNMRALTDSLDSSSQINATTSGLGNSGNIWLQIDDDITLSGQSLIFSQVGNNGRGRAGDIDITARSLSMTQGAEVAASVFRAENGLPGGIGEGGDIQINATDFVNIEGIGSGGFSSGIFANTQSGASGTGGDISLTTGALRVANGGVVTAQTLNGSNSGDISIIANTLLLEGGGQLVADTRSGGSAGTVALTISGDTIIFGVDPNYRNRLIQFPSAPVANVSEKSGIFVPTSQDSTGNGGSIFVQSGSLAILEGGQVSAESLGSGLAGNIEILTNSSGLFSYGSTPIRYALLMRNGDIVTQAQQSDGGNISVISLGSAPIVLLEDSDIATDSLGNGGNITLDSVVITFDDSDILARSFDARGGNITLGPFFSDTLPFGAVSPTENNARVDVSADGQLASGAITTPNTSFIQNSLNQLPALVTDPSTLIAGSCIARTDNNQGAFVATGSGGLAARPGDGVISSYPTGSVQPLPATEPQAVWQPGDPIVEPTGAFSLPDGRLVLARECDEPAGSSTSQSVLEPTG